MEMMMMSCETCRSSFLLRLVQPSDTARFAANAGSNEMLKQVGVALMKQHQHPEISSKYFMYMDRNRRYINVSDGMCELFKWRRCEILGKAIEWLTTQEAPMHLRVPSIP